MVDDLEGMHALKTKEKKKKKLLSTMEVSVSILIGITMWVLSILTLQKEDFAVVNILISSAPSLEPKIVSLFESDSLHHIHLHVLLLPVTPIWLFMNCF